ncbi:translation initiation factor IF-1 [Candidatus Gracilibacteria bacterium]|nr:translation initiation factor IF-1 [Candidatus Gracilibacteria bacterium]NVP18085.1 translation initiation factor IF-1 [Candidatus Gracilibacteria bacterium]
MSNKEDKIEVEGTIIKALPGLVFDIQLPEEFGGTIIQGYLSGKMRNNFIKLIEGDKVLVELSPYDLTKGRIVFRQK